MSDSCRRCCQIKDLFTVCLDCYGEVAQALALREKQVEVAKEYLQYIKEHVGELGTYHSVKDALAKLDELEKNEVGK